MERCPACRSRLGDTPLCPRCGCDFTLAFRAEKRAQSLLRQSLEAWCNGDLALAEACIIKSKALKNGRLANAAAAMQVESAQAGSVSHTLDLLLESLSS